jgi:hypothetical protein
VAGGWLVSQRQRPSRGLSVRPRREAGLFAFLFVFIFVVIIVVANLSLLVHTIDCTFSPLVNMKLVVVVALPLQLR